MTQDKLIAHQHYIRQHGQDMSEIRNWTWRNPPSTSSRSGHDGEVAEYGHPDDKYQRPVYVSSY